MYKLFSRRQQELNHELPDVFEYDIVPEEFRIQVFYILSDISNYFPSIWSKINTLFSREKGWRNLRHAASPEEECGTFLLSATTEDLIDYIDFTFNFINYSLRREKHFGIDIIKIIINAIDELNYRLKYHSLGYEFIDGQLIRINNTVLHKTVLKPAFLLLYNHNFSGANDEMHKAFEFRNKCDNKNAIIEANKAFESTMKTICDCMGFTYVAAKSTAKDLVKILEDNQFYPSYLNNYITGIRTTLESGLPTIRNKTAGHGQGSSVVPIPDEYVDYALNLVATNIVFLVKIFESKS